MPKKLVNSRLKRTLIAVAVSAVSLSASAAGLGRITVLSGLGQPLRAEVEIAATPEELQNLTAKLASAEAFRQAGVDYSPSVSGLRMAVERRGNGAVVRVSSDRPINEPFVDMLVELNWSSGRLIREYTFLLDPPDTGVGRAIDHRFPAAAAGGCGGRQLQGPAHACARQYVAQQAGRHLGEATGVLQVVEPDEEVAVGQRHRCGDAEVDHDADEDGVSDGDATLIGRL